MKTWGFGLLVALVALPGGVTFAQESGFYGKSDGDAFDVIREEEIRKKEEKASPPPGFPEASSPIEAPPDDVGRREDANRGASPRSDEEEAE